MLGFKSFANKTGLEFSTGITAVVGPNGAGKSNVADAVRWVLGEQSMRQLRGKKSDDIIFVGGQGRAAQGMAEVSLTIDNSTGWVPSDYSEITVTRRSYRSGENEYLINKQKVRLKDVLLLLAQARIGHDSYTVVGQGLIDAALSLRAEERRGLFEDAAGIRPYQVQRTDAEGRLRSTEQNLDRLRDIVSEIEPRLEPLAEQARRAVEYKQLNGELQEVLLTWYALQWRRLRTTRERTELVEQQQTRLVQQKEQAMREVEERRALLRGQRQQAQSKIVEARAVLGEASDSVKHIERDLAVSQERMVGLERQRGEQQQEEKRLRERLIALKQQLIDLEEQCDLADESIDDDAAALATRESEVAKAQKEFEMDERRLRTTQSELIQVQARLGASQSDMGRQQKHLGERNRLLATRRDTIAHSQQAMRTLETRLVEERAQQATVRNEEQQISQRKQAIGRAIADAQQEMERLKSSLAEAERQRRVVSDRLNMLKNWRQSLSGYSDGVRALLRAPQGKLPGLLGPVPQLGIAPAGQELALEAAFGPYLQAVVVETLEAARACLDYLQSAKAGKAMVAWLERSDASVDISDAQLELEDAALSRLLAAHPELQARVTGLGWRAISCEPRYLPLFRTILRDILIVNDLDTARQLHELLSGASASEAYPRSERLVTLQGEVLHREGWLTGGNSKDGGQQGLLAYERELRELPRQLDEHMDLISQINDLLSTAQRSQEGRKAEQGAIEKEQQKNAARLGELNRAVATTQREQDRQQSELQAARSVEQQLVSEIAGLEQEIAAATERVHAHEKSQRELSGLVEDLQQEVEERTIAFRRQQDELGKARTALAVKRQEARALRQQLASQTNSAQDLRAQIDARAARIKEAEERYLVLQQTVEQHQAEIAEAQQRVQVQVEVLRRAEEEAATLDARISTLEQESLQLRQQLAELEVSYRKCLLDSQKARDAVESLLAQLNEEMGITDPQELARYATTEFAVIESSEERVNGSGTQRLAVGEALSEEEEAELRKLRRRVDILRSRLKSLGGSDPEAPVQYEETRTRYEFLTTQIADMDSAALQLRTIIAQLDVTMARQFETTFQAINARFRENFVTLFKGGSARLELIAAKGDDENGDSSAPRGMPAGIEVIVQPPGKRVQDLSLLSGGERAMVSAALLFSLLEINPPPFCMLDEVDAALDESNVNRFCDILRRLAQRTQFIVITHNRVTMTSASAIYGVSMGGDSVSRLLSLRLEEAHAVAGDR
jgi:chromosome segregation protein